MAKTLKEQTVSALFWNFMDKGGQQIFQFVFTFILVRLLVPAEFGLIAVLSLFIAVANILQESGFSSAIIRKKEVDEVDYSSVFYFNIFISFLIYLIFFFFAPVIADFYNSPVLTRLSRFLFLAFIFNSFGIVQNIHLTRKMDFKTNARITLLSVLLSGIVAVYLAYKAYGVWSLATQQVLQALLRSSFLWLSVKWYPKVSFNMKRLHSMSGYSAKLLLNSLFNQLTANIYSMVIGKRFSLSDTGYYSQANKLNAIPQSVIATTLQGVAFPLLNKFHDDLAYKKRIFRKVVRVVCFACFPVAILTIVAAEPIVRVVLKGGEWLGVIPILQILAVGSAVMPLFYLLSSLLQSVGKSGLLLSIEFARNLISVLTILFSIKYGVNGVVIGASCVMVLSFFCGYHVAGKCINYKIKELIKDIFPYFLLSVISFLPVYFLSKFIDNMLVLLLLEIVVGGAIYLSLLHFFGSKVMGDFLCIIRRKGLK